MHQLEAEPNKAADAHKCCCSAFSFSDKAHFTKLEIHFAANFGVSSPRKGKMIMSPRAGSRNTALMQALKRDLSSMLNAYVFPLIPLLVEAAAPLWLCWPSSLSGWHLRDLFPAVHDRIGFQQLDSLTSVVISLIVLRLSRFFRIATMATLYADKGAQTQEPVLSTCFCKRQE